MTTASSPGPRPNAGDAAYDGDTDTDPRTNGVEVDIVMMRSVARNSGHFVLFKVAFASRDFD